MAKMDWLVKKYKNGECEYLLNGTEDTKGTFVMPTGMGKSGVVMEDMMYQIDHKDPNRKLILNFSTPILKLARQMGQDLFSVLTETHTDYIRKGKIVFYINSSDSFDGYDAIENGIDTFRFDEIDKFYNSSRAEIAIVASCHKSMDKFVTNLPKMKEHALVCTYLDEAHLFNTIKTTHSHGGKDYNENPCLERLCEYSDYLYAMTATPDRGVTEKINVYNMHNGSCSYFIYKIDAREGIEMNVILPPRVEIMHLNDNEVLNASILIGWKNRLKKVHNYALKILVTCSNSKELKMLENSLIKKGEKVFSTCSASGCHNSEGELAEEVDEVNFMHIVDEYNGDCFVLHIRQLIQGIDIKSITSCVICTASHCDSETNKKHVQIIGRTLRTAQGERGLPITKRTKKVGDVLFLMPNGFDGENSIVNFIEKYYGVGYIVGDYRKTNGPHSSSDIDIMDNPFNFGTLFKDDEEHNSTLLLINIENYIKTRLMPKHRFLIKNGGNGIDIEKEMEKIENNCGAFDDDYDSVILLSRTNLQNAIKDLFAKYDIVEIF